MPMMTWELWLARDIVSDNPSPSPTRERLAPRQKKSTVQLTPGFL
jgi:hypothetical protein